MSVTEPQTSAGTSVSERLVAALAGLWRAIQARHPDVPEVVFVLGSGTAGRRRTGKHGHFANRRWIQRTTPASDREDQAAEQYVHEVEVGGEGLVRGPLEVFGTVLHEATHALADARGIADTTPNGRYHNRRFAVLARELGLDVVDNGANRGWNGTSVPAETAEKYAAQLEVLEAALTVYRVPEPTRPAGSAPAGRLLKAQCGCPQPINIWGARSTFEAQVVTCSRCGEPFTVPG